MESSREEPDEGPPTTRDESSGLDDLVVEFLDRLDGDPQGLLEAMCREHPDHAEGLRRRIGVLGDTGLLERGSTEPAALPESLGGFRLLGRLGGGGMGVVYRAHDEALDREVALKVVRPEQLFFEEARARFRREVSMIARLSHPGIVPVYSVGEHEGLPYFAMERVRGATLAGVLRVLAQGNAIGRRGAGGPEGLRGQDLSEAIDDAAPDATAPDIVGGTGAAGEPGGAEGEHLASIFRGNWAETCAHVAREVAVALDHAHALGVVHRDVKPSNVMVTRSGRVMLLDFGLSSEERAERITRTGSRVGSLPYMPPELLDGSTEIDARGDVYSLGVTLYELLTLRLPFSGKSLGSLRQQVAEGRPTPVREFLPNVPWEIETVCMAAMDPDPARRYATAGEFARDLTRAIERRPIHARRAGPWLRARRWAQRRPALAVGMAAAFLLVVVAPSLFAWQQLRAARALRVKQEELTRTNGELERSLAEVERQRGLVAANFTLASDAVDQMLTRVGDEVLRGVPYVEELRAGILEDALRFEEALLAQVPTDPDQRRSHAESMVRVGEIRGMLGNTRGAIEVLETYLATLADLGEEARQGEGQRALARGWWRLARAYRQGDRLDEAVDAAREGLRVLEGDADTGNRELLEAELRLELGEIARRRGRGDEERVALSAAVELLRARIATDGEGGTPGEQPGGRSFEARVLLAKALHALATPALVEERVAAPELARRGPLLAEAVELRRALVEQERTPGLRADLADSLVSLGNHAMARGDSGAARGAFEEACAIGEDLRTRHPGIPSFTEVVAVSTGNLASLAGLEGHTEEENRLMGRALEAFESLRTGSPGNLDYARKSLYLHFNLGMNIVNAGEGDFDLGEEHLGRCVEIGRELAVANALGPMARAPIDAQGLLGYCRAKQGRHLEGADAVAAMLEMNPDAAQVGVGAAVLAQCLQAARADRTLSDDEREAAEEEHASFALELLHRSLSESPDPSLRREIAEQETLLPLMELPEFDAILAEFGLGSGVGDE